MLIFMKFTDVDLKPHKIEDSYAFMFETTYLVQTTKFAFEDGLPYEDAWKVMPFFLLVL